MNWLPAISSILARPVVRNLYSNFGQQSEAGATTVSQPSDVSIAGDDQRRCAYAANCRVRYQHLHLRKFLGEDPVSARQEVTEPDYRSLHLTAPGRAPPAPRTRCIVTRVCRR